MQGCSSSRTCLMECGCTSGDVWGWDSCDIPHLLLWAGARKLRGAWDEQGKGGKEKEEVEEGWILPEERSRAGG